MTQIISNNNGGGGGAGAYKYKGSVDYYEDLPTSGMKIGDTYNVVNPFTQGGKDYPAGTNVAWTGTEWDALGGSIDLSDYQKKLVEGDGIDLDQDTNEISVDTEVIATKQDLSTKQDTISDLETIRSNASAGKSAKDTIDTYGNIVTHNVSEFATSAQGTKADSAIQPNDNISELNNDSGFITKDVNNLTNYTKTTDLPDFTTYQLKSNMVTSLNSADDNHYPTAKAVKDAITAGGNGDVTGPNSAVDGHLAVFDGTTGKLIKDGGAIPTPTTVVDDLTTQSATSALSANQGYVLDGKIATINGKIPSEASTSNKLADKQFVNDAINSVTAYYITKDAQGNQFATYAELAAATVFYSGGVQRTPTRNDYTIVLDDETHSDEVTRYIYNNGWEYQYTINESPLTQAQLDALNSGITSGKVSSYDSVVTTIGGYGNIVTHNTSEFATSSQGDKADSALQPNDNISELNNDSGYITGVDWGDIGGTLSDQVDLNNALGAKANDSGVVHTTGAETINGTKTFGTSPTVPSKSSDAGNNPTVIATEAQVAKKQNTLVSGTNIKTVNSNDLLGSGNISLNEVPSIGNVGDVLTKTNDGYEFQEIPKELPTTGNVGDVLTKTADGVDFLAPQSGGGGVQEYLGVEGIVGENYTLSNTLFKQNTPSLADCYAETNVGDIADNTQIHIQRIGSGTASNELKLYVKKVGTPGNLSVQVMEGVKVDVSTTEAYWYGNSNNILATGTISSEDITTSFQEITVSLSGNVGGTKGQLLDIVLSIPSVSSSNYVVIACDGTQWSEAFSYVSVNGSTRTRSKAMPYCISDGFAEELLVKADSSDYSLYGEYKDIFNFNRTYSGSTSGVTAYQKTFSSSLLGYTFKSTATNAGNTRFILYDNSTQVFLAFGNQNRSGTFDGSTGHTIKVTLDAWGGGTVTIDLVILLKGNFDCKKGGPDYKGYARSSTVKNIGEIETITIFGVNSDNSWIDYPPPLSTGGFIKYCKSYGVAHSVSSNNYTMTGYGYVQWWIKTNNGDNLPAVNINGVRINSNGYATSYFRLTEGFYTLQPGDIVTAGSNVSITDYY